MRPLQDRLQAAQALLAPYAVPHVGILGRVHKEPEDATRFPFQRDRDRIIHTQAFRRLKGKTQVFVTGIGDHYRTRLTHTMEVAQISRDIARTLLLNEDLSECIALAHDLGHPPFGHAGEDALNAWMQQHGGHFEHNEQSYRIVTLLEERTSAYPGLNLNREVLAGLLKHQTAHDSPSVESAGLFFSLEAQVVNLADEIAYTGHDTDDGLRAGLFTLQDVTDIPLAAKAAVQARERGTELRGALINMLVMDLYAASENAIDFLGIRTIDNVKAAGTSAICFSQPLQHELAELRSFLWERMYLHPSVRERSAQGERVVTALCESLFTHPNDKVKNRHGNSGGALEEAVKDYVAGMTDAFAMAQASERGLVTV